MSSLIEQDLCLKGHVYFNKVADGVYFQGQAGGFVLKGENIYPPIFKIVSLIDNGHSLEAINTKLPEKLQVFFHKLVSRLHEHDMLVERGVEELVAEDRADDENFRRFLLFLKENTDDLGRKFSAWQESKILIVGDGQILRSALGSLVEMGLDSIAVALTGSEEMSDFDRLLNELGERYSGFSYQLKMTDEFGEAALSEFECIIQCSSNLNLDLEIGPHSPTVVAGVLEGLGLVSPVTDISSVDFRDVVDQAAQSNSEQQVEFPDSGLSILGNIAVLNIAKAYFGIQTGGIRNYVYSVSPLLEISRHPLLPSIRERRNDSTTSSSSTDYEFQQEYEMPEDREMDKYEKVRLALNAFFDPLFGCFDESVGDTVKQVPLFHSKLITSLPKSWGMEDSSIMCCGMDASTSGLRAIAEAISLRTSGDLEIPHHLITTGYELGEWQKRAVAVALANTDEFASSSSSMLIDFSALADEEIQIITHYLLSSGYETKSLELHWDKSASSFVARISNANELRTSTAIAATPMEAIRECLCAAYIRVQFPDTRLLETQGSSLALVSPEREDENGLVLAELINQEHSQLIPEVNYIHSIPELMKHGIYSGYAKL